MNTLIHTPTNDLQESLDFYGSLNFKIVSERGPSLVSDGKACIEINPSRFARAGVKMYKTSWKEEVEKLKEMTPILSIDDGYVLADPSDVRIYLIEGASPVSQSPEDNSFSTLGNFAGLSLETMSIPVSMALWEILGFSKSMGEIEQGWVLCSNDEGFGVSFMGPNTCPHLFFNPSMTYFNGGKNLPVIQKIRDAGIPITEEITHFNKEGIVDNVIIRDPGGYGFFIFND